MVRARPTERTAGAPVTTNGVTVTPNCLLDPLFGTAAGVTNGSTKYFQNNIIPTARINPIGQNLINLYPTVGAVAGLAALTPSSAAYEAFNASGTDLLGDRADELVAKLDHQVFKWWYANVSYSHYGSKEPGGNPLHSAAGDESPQSSYLLYRKVDSVTTNSTFTINPTTIATFGFGFNRFPNNTIDLSNGYNLTQLASLRGLPRPCRRRRFLRSSC